MYREPDSINTFGRPQEAVSPNPDIRGGGTTNSNFNFGAYDNSPLSQIGSTNDLVGVHGDATTRTMEMQGVVRKVNGYVVYILNKAGFAVSAIFANNIKYVL